VISDDCVRIAEETTARLGLTSYMPTSSKKREKIKKIVDMLVAQS
jgi:hypothetical protein